MASFPTLKTGAVAQYPLNVALRYQTESVSFLDGSRQRFRIRGKGLRKWGIRLDLLDNDELAALVAFAEQQGSATFAFTDPATGQAVSKCVIAESKFEATAMDEMMARSTVLIEEIA